MDVIPAIDLLDGQVVRLQKGSYNDVTVYNDNPLDQAKTYKDAGFDHIHIVDLNGARDGEFINLEHIQQIVEELEMSVQTGGGIRSFDDVQMLLDSGLNKVVCSSMAIKNEDDWFKALDEYPDQCILGMDLKEGQMAYAGWKETIEESTDEFLQRMIDHGVREVLCTDISRDGTMLGTNTLLYKNLKNHYSDIRFIASGGVASAGDLEKLAELDMDAVVVGRAYYEEKLTLDEMQKYHQ